jgi:hypothetical protein
MTGADCGGTAISVEAAAVGWVPAATLTRGDPGGVVDGGPVGGVGRRGAEVDAVGC